MATVLGLCSLRTTTKITALFVMVFISVGIFATREIPKQFDTEDEEWKIWRNLDFSVCVVSLVFATVLLYGSIVEFRMFVLFWLQWNLVFVVYWLVFLIRKYDEFITWERIFRIVAIAFMVFAELLVYGYQKNLKERTEDPESLDSTWKASQIDEDYKTLCDRRSIVSSSSSVFKNSPSADNFGFQEDMSPSETPSLSASTASEVPVEAEEKETDSDAETSSSSEVSVDVHSQRSENVEQEVHEIPMSSNEKVLNLRPQTEASTEIVLVQLVSDGQDASASEEATGAQTDHLNSHSSEAKQDLDNTNESAEFGSTGNSRNTSQNDTSSSFGQPNGLSSFPNVNDVSNTVQSPEQNVVEPQQEN